MGSEQFNVCLYIKGMHLEHGGTVTAVVNLIRGLVDYGHSVTLLTHEVGSGYDHLPFGARFRTLTGGSHRFALTVNPQLIGRWKHAVAEADVVHLNGVWSPAAAQLAKLAKESETPYVVTTHGMLSDWPMGQKRWKKTPYLYLILRRMLQNADAVLCTSDAELAQAKKRVIGARWLQMPYIFDTRPYMRLPGGQKARRTWPWLQTNHIKLLYLGRMHPKKGLHRAIESVFILKKRGLPVTLTVAGTWSNARYRARVDRLIVERALTDNVRFVGFVSGQMKLSLYQACDVFLLPTEQENFGFVTYEAMACGTAALISRGVDTWPELALRGGAMVTSLEPPEIASALVDRLDKGWSPEATGSRARQWIMGELGIERGAERYLELYADVAR